MWYHSTTERVIGIFETSCGYCGQKANFKLSREEDFFLFLFVIPFWSSGNYYTTCGNCHNTFKLKTKEGKALEKEILGYMGRDKRLSNVKKNLIVLGVLVALIIAATFFTGSIEEETPTYTPTPTSTPTPAFEGVFIDKYTEAEEKFYEMSYESELKADESAKLAGSYYERDQLNKAGDKYSEAAEFYSRVREQNLEAKASFEEAYETAPTEYYKELCRLYINATQSYSELMKCRSSAMKHMEKACDYYEKEDYKAGDEEIEEQGKEIMRYNIGMETYNTLIEKINELEYR